MYQGFERVFSTCNLQVTCLPWDYFITPSPYISRRQSQAFHFFFPVCRGCLQPSRGQPLKILETLKCGPVFPIWHRMLKGQNEYFWIKYLFHSTNFISSFKTCPTYYQEIMKPFSVVLRGQYFFEKVLTTIRMLWIAASIWNYLF